MNDNLLNNTSTGSLAKVMNNSLRNMSPYCNELSRSFKKSNISNGLFYKNKNMQLQSNQLSSSGSTRNNIQFSKIVRENKLNFSNNRTKESTTGSPGGKNGYRASLQNEQVFSSFGSKGSGVESQSINKGQDIDTPEELHFFYVNMFQSGKNLGDKF